MNGPWVTLDVAMHVLGLGRAHTLALAKRDAWRRTPTKPRGYQLEDIQKTARLRKDQER